MGNACSDITPTFDAQKKLDDDKASLTRDLVMDEEASSKLPMTFQARYKMGDILGKGAFSTVRLGTSKINNKKWAVKAVARKDLPQVDEDALRSEVAILRKLPYRHIVYCKDFFEEASHYYMVSLLLSSYYYPYCYRHFHNMCCDRWKYIPYNPC